MRQILSSNANLVGAFDPPFVKDDAKQTMRVMAEVILTVTEPARAFVQSKDKEDCMELAQIDKIDEFRFVASASALRELAKNFDELADSAEMMQEKFEQPAKA